MTRTPLYSAEHLTRTQLRQARAMVRRSTFFPDPNLPAGERAELHDYVNSGNDRGHMAPSADMPTQKSQQECFSLANIVPQEPGNNRGVWEGIERSVRQLALERGELYVVTGPIFAGNHLRRIGGAVMVPTQLFKAVYDPVKKVAGVYLVDNAATALPRIISVAELAHVAGIDVFPGLSAQIKANAMTLPETEPHRQHHRKEGR